MTLHRAGNGLSLIAMTNLFASIPDVLPEELVETLLQADGVRIERIVSHGHASPPGLERVPHQDSASATSEYDTHWYDQAESEWVLLVAGAARLRFEDKVIEMRPGDFVNIPAHTKHRVEWTSPKEKTIWLAVFYEASPPS